MFYAKYTIVLKTLMDDPQSKAMLDKALSTYPLHTPKNPSNYMIIPTREEINEKLLNHYKYREIGFETFGRFLDELEIAMKEIMPKYNQLFNSEDIINGLDDIFGNLDVTETFEQETSGTSSNTSERSETGKTTGSESVETTENNSSSGTANTSGSDSSTNTNTMNSNTKNVKSDTPQSQLGITAENIDSVSYASEVDWNKSNSSSNGSTSGESSSETETSNTETKSSTTEGSTEQNTTTTGNVSDSGTTSGTTTHTLTRKGNQGVNTYAHDMNEFRELFLNIVQDIIHDSRIEELFMCIY